MRVSEDALETVSRPIEIEEAYRAHAGRLWRSLVAYTASREIATEAVAEAFAQALARGDALADAGAWVWKAGFRIAAGQMARRTSSSPPPDRPVIEPGYEQAEDADALIRALASLPSRQRAVVVLRYYADMPLRDIAATLSIAVPTVGVHLTQARRRLRDLLEETYE
jgi:RNA polymerase sigma-70 factor (ECF subfamily)